MKTRRILIGVMFLGICSTITGLFIDNQTHAKYLLIGGSTSLVASAILYLINILWSSSRDLDFIRYEPNCQPEVDPTGWGKNEINEKPEENHPLQNMTKENRNLKDALAHIAESNNRAEQLAGPRSVIVTIPIPDPFKKALLIKDLAFQCGLKQIEGKNEYKDEAGNIFYAGKYGFRQKSKSKSK